MPHCSASFVDISEFSLSASVVFCGYLRSWVGDLELQIARLQIVTDLSVPDCRLLFLIMCPPLVNFLQEKHSSLHAYVSK